ncbi:MAG: endo-1,4-beta-xylanase, partial [Puniceicoccales bacterium]
MRTPLIALLWIVQGLSISTAENLPPEGISILPPSPLTQERVFYSGYNHDHPVAEAELVEVDYPEFTKAMRVDVIRPNGKFYNGAISLRATQAVSAGDTLLIQLYFRSLENTEESGYGFATVFLQGPKPNYKKYLIREVTATDQWQKYTLPVRVTDDLPVGKLDLSIGAGSGSKPQIWEVGGIELLNYGSSVSPSELPKTQGSYIGRDPDAQWRSAAEERIEKHRKGDYRIQILDTCGNPIPGVNIEIEQLRHAYHFGSAISAALLTGTSEDSETYREKVLELFNQSGPENDLKWPAWKGDWGKKYQREQTRDALLWLESHHFYTRGHVLVWPSIKHLPQILHPYLTKDAPEAVDPIAKQIVLDHIADITTATSDLLDEWDVVNEPYSNHDFMDAYGQEVMVDWFKEARKHLPTQALYLNDYGILSAGGRDLNHQLHYEQTLRYLLDNQAPLTGMGMQGHFSNTPTPIDRVYRILDHFHSTFPELEIRITEFDVQTDDESLQADYTRDFLTIAFSHPATVGVQCWGFWAGRHWKPEAAMYTIDWEEKPNARIWKELTRKVWWTHHKGVTNREGS